MDYTATVLNSVVPLSWACALLLLRRVGPVRRGRVLLTVGAAGFVAMLSATPSGTLLGQSWADWPWAIGAMTGVVATMTAGLITLTVPHRWRWTGLLLVTIPVGMGQLALAGAAAWIALAVALPWLAAAGRTRPQLPAARRSRGGVVIATLMAPSAFLGGLALSGGYHPPVRAAAGVVAIGSIVVLLLSIAPTPHSLAVSAAVNVVLAGLEALGFSSSVDGEAVPRCPPTRRPRPLRG